MSFDTQIALARPPRAESTHLSRAARQVVPPFLQKLYEIVNDPANEELIRWSENGDSFYVLNHEKFAREVLGRWFKHQKFASFVRQLNMYGFHKIPHLQQGVLKSDTDTEPWHFEHPNFHRGQPDLLCLIQRKKQPTHGNSEDPAAIDIHDPNSPNGLANLSAGQVMDINSIVNGIAVIKRHQQAISADLSALKQSNDALWKEAVAARQRHAKHQDTINRILKFLAGVFGHGDESGHSSDGSHSPPQVTPRVRQRLMIGDSRVPAATKGKHVDIVEVEDDEADLLRKNRGRSPFSDQYATIEPIEHTETPPAIVEAVTPSESYTPASNGSPGKNKTSPPVRPSNALSRSTSSNSVPRLSASPSSAPVHPAHVNGATPFAANGQNSNDHMWQSAIQHMMQSPAQFQRIMKAFANHQQQPLSGLTPDGIHENHGAVSPYENGTQTEYSRWYNQPVASSSTAPVSQSLLAHSEEQSMQLLMEESNRLQKNYRDAAEIDADMDMLQTSIDSLIQNLGIDPGTLAVSQDEHVHPHTNGVNGMNGVNGYTPNGSSDYSTPLTPESYTNGSPYGLSGMHAMGGLSVPDSGQPDYLLDSLLSQIGDGPGRMDGALHGAAGIDYADVTGNYDHSARIDGTSIEDASTEQLTAFLDEASSGSTSSEATPSTASPLLPPGAVSQTSSRPHPPPSKRKVVDVPLSTSPEVIASRKVKRKR